MYPSLPSPESIAHCIYLGAGRRSLSFGRPKTLGRADPDVASPTENRIPVAEVAASAGRVALHYLSCERLDPWLSSFFRCRDGRTDFFLEVVQSPAQAVVTIDARLPSQKAAGALDVGPADLGIILRQRLVNDRARAAG